MRCLQRVLKAIMNGGKSHAILIHVVFSLACIDKEVN